jgi:putative N6-adenine-specific DNA methylase
MPDFELFAPCPRGLEAPLAAELHDIARTAPLKLGATVPGGVHFRGDWSALMAANLHSRLASRILLRVAQRPYRNEQDIYALARDQVWEHWFTPQQTLRVDVTAIKSPLRSLDFVTLRVKDAICDRLRDERGARPSIDTVEPDVRVSAFLTATDCTLYLDTSGEPLFKRGWRQDKGAAPLRENLAAGILALTGWRPGVALYDPMCGSGTFLAEAAQIARGIAPGMARAFGFEQLLRHEGAAWRKLQDAARALEQRTAAADLNIYGSDISGDMLDKARRNLARAGVPELPLKQLDARHITPPASGAGILVANPPYGERIEIRGPRGEVREVRDLRDTDAGEHGDARLHRTQTDQTDAAFFNAFGDALKQRFSGWQAFVLTTDRKLPGQMRLRESLKTPLFNGALECRLFKFDLVAGSVRQRAEEPRAAD